MENGHVDHSPQSTLQGGNDQSAPLQDRDDERTTDMETTIHCIDSLNVEDHDLIVARGTDVTSQTEQNSDVQDQHRNDVSCVDNSISCCADNHDEQNEVLTDIKLYKDAMSYKDITCSNYNAESQQISSINYASTHINTIEKENLQVEDLNGASYKGPPVHAYEQDQDMQSISHAIVNHSCGHNINSSSEMSDPKASIVIVTKTRLVAL